MSHMERVSGPAVPSAIDEQTPSIARVYDAALFGKDNFAIDREVLRQVCEVAPDLPKIARDNRDWLIRVTRFLAGQVGLDQFLDIGSGLPTAENTHQAAQRVNPDAEVVYVDNDPVVLAHGRALLEDNDLTHIFAADMTEPEAVLADEGLNRWLDFTRPVALFQVSTIHHVPDEADPWRIMRTYVDALPSGSYIALTHFHHPGGEDGVLAEQMQQQMVNSPMGSGYFRTRDEIAGFFDGLELIDPGLVVPPDWWPDGPRVKPLLPVQRCLLGGVARKP